MHSSIPPRLLPLLPFLAATALGCDPQGEDPPSREAACAIEAEDAFDSCISLSGADTEICEDLADMQAQECTEPSLGKADEAFTDQDTSVLKWLQGAWKARGDECLASGNLPCLESNLRLGAWAGERFYGWETASDAMRKFLDCDTSDLVLDFDELYEQSQPWLARHVLQDGNKFIAQATDDAIAEAVQWVQDERPSVGSRIDFPPQLVQGGTSDHWMTFATATLRGFADIRSIDGSSAEVRVFFQLSDNYDFHPDRVISEDGDTLGSKWTMNRWAEALVEGGAACEYRVRAYHSVTWRVQFQ